jgi:hypothetical protein
LCRALVLSRSRRVSRRRRAGFLVGRRRGRARLIRGQLRDLSEVKIVVMMIFVVRAVVMIICAERNGVILPVQIL